MQDIFPYQNFQRDQDGNFIPPREGYINDVVVEGQVVIQSSILVTDAKNRKRNDPAQLQNSQECLSESFGKVGFNKEAKELTYPSMDQAIEDYDEEHARGDPPQTVVSRRLTLDRKVINSLLEFNKG